MSTLVLVRHGQASFLADDYDRLSPLGHAQAAALGSFWSRRQIRFDQVYVGPARRHAQTEASAGAAYETGSNPWPAATVIPELDEYPGIEVMREFLPGLIEREPEIRELHSQFRAAAAFPEASRAYDLLFQRITRRWVAGELDSPSVETWAAFCNRVAAGIQRIRDCADASNTIVAFTSGGTIAAAARIALELTPERTLELSWASRNASYTEFRFAPSRFSLSSFNNLPHLEDAALLTYR